MNRKIVSMALLFGAAALSGCASTTWNGYPGGTVKYSQIKYDYTAQPILKDPAGKTYQLQSDATLAGLTSIPALEKRGVSRAEGGADVLLSVSGGAIKHEPGSFGFGPYKPALISTMPLTIQVKDKSGQMILERQVRHEEILGVPGAKEFPTREEAKKAMAAFMDVAQSGADAKVQQGASRTAAKSLDLLAKDLFEPREVTVTLPAIRSAGEVDMEMAYTLLSEAENDAQVKKALDAYLALGTDHKKPDGTEDVVGVYGVLCGSASAKILSGDLPGAWAETKQAWEIMPEGKEHRLIARVLKQQQDQAGVEVIPPEDLAQMENADKNAAAQSLKSLFGGKK